jgi:hypothetical protein
METKKCPKCGRELPISHFYQKKDGEYDYLCKEDRKGNIIDNKPWTALEACKYFDIPFIEYEWFSLVDHRRRHRNTSIKDYFFIKGDTIFGKYLSKMKLKSFQNYTYEDSSYINSIIKEEKTPIITNIEKYIDEFLLNNEKEYFNITKGRKNNEN